MKLFKIYSLILSLGLAILIGCESPINNNSELTVDTEISSENEDTQKNVILKATGEFTAKWTGCENEQDGQDHGGCGGDCDESDNGTGEDGCDHEEDDGTVNTCGNPHPAKEFYMRFDAQFDSLKEITKGEVVFKGIGSYKDIEFTGRVIWVQRWPDKNYAGIERTDKDLLFGGIITGGTVKKKRFLFSIRDNGQGKNSEADRLQYRVYGKEGEDTCGPPNSFPNGYPKGYPIALEEGNLMVH